jgi:hypothetical protein
MPTATASKTPKPTRQITITLRRGHAVPPNPFPFMKVGQTVRYVSKSGEVSINFTGLSPFRIDKKEDTTVPGGVILTLVKSSEGLPNGSFHCGCSITDKKGVTRGWGKGSKLSGGNPRVGRP